MDFDFSKFEAETKMFKDASDVFMLERAGKIINNEIYAFFSSSEYPSSIETIDFNEIFEDDVLIHKNSGKRCIVTNVEPVGNCAIIKYETNSQRMRQQQTTGNISIGNIGGSAIIGNQQYATIDNSSIQNLKEIISSKTEDKEILEKLLNRIETIIEDNQPVSKGTFSKFAYIFKKYPDVLNAAGALLIKLFSNMI